VEVDVSISKTVRKVIRIDEEKCDGCGDCVTACQEGAIQIVDGTAKLVSETYCDGLGACIGDCPQGAITIEEREAAAYDETAVEQHLNQLKQRSTTQVTSNHHAGMGGCPGSASRELKRAISIADLLEPHTADAAAEKSELSHWPVQLMLVPPQAPYLRGCDLLICADCVPFALSNFHGQYLRGKRVLVGCPKLDDLDYYFEKLQRIFEVAQPNSITVLKMEVPCCHGIASAAMRARDEVAPQIPIEVHTIGIEGELVERRQAV